MGVHRVRAARVHDRGAHAACLELLASLLAEAIEVAERQDRDLGPLADAREVHRGRRVVGERHERGPVHVPCGGHANRDGAERGPGRAAERPVEHREVLLGAGGREISEARDAAEHRDVEEAEVRGVRGAMGRAAEHEERDLGRVQRGVMDELVEAALKEGAVDAHDRSCARLRERGRIGHRVPLGDADVHELLACGLATLGPEAHDVGGGGAYRHHIGVGSHAAQEKTARELSVVALLLVERAGLVAALELAGLRVEGAHVVPGLGVGLGGRVPAALDGVDVQDAGAVASAQLCERLLERAQVVAVLKVAVVEPERAEEVVLARALGRAELGEHAVEAAGIRCD